MAKYFDYEDYLFDEFDKEYNKPKSEQEMIWDLEEQKVREIERRYEENQQIETMMRRMIYC